MFAKSIGCRPITFGVTACSLRLEVILSPVSYVHEVSSSKCTWASTAFSIASLNSAFAFVASFSPRIVRADKNVRGSSRMAIKILSPGTSKRCCIAHSSRFKAHFATSPRACRSFSKLRATFASVVPFCCFVLTLMIRKGPRRFPLLRSFQRFQVGKIFAIRCTITVFLAVSCTIRLFLHGTVHHGFICLYFLYLWIWIASMWWWSEVTEGDGNNFQLHLKYLIFEIKGPKNDWNLNY